jgi:hypothetical protein
MRYAEAEDQLRVASDQIERDCRDAVLARDAQLAREATRSPSLRQRAGEAVIAFGVRLAGDRRSRQDERRLITRPT